MQYMMQNRVTHTQATGYNTPYIDVGESPLLTINLIIYSISGAGAGLSIDLETSDDLETWSTVTSIVSGSAPGSTVGAIEARNQPFGKYVRFTIALSGTNPTATFSAVINTFPSS